MTYQILFKHESVAVISVPLYAYYQNPNGIMGVKWTPVHAAAIDALQEHVDYFAKYGFVRSYQFSLRQLIGNTQGQIISAKKFGTEYAAEIKRYEEHYWSYLKKYRRDLSLREKIKARIAIHPKLNFIFVFHGNVVNNGLLFALKALGKHI